MSIKAGRFTEFLESNEIKCFTKEEWDDSLETTVFRSTMEVEGQTLPTIVVLDNSIYSLVRVMVIPKVLSKRSLNTVLEYINELNRKYKVFKYYVTEEGDLCIDACITSTQEEFNPNVAYTVIDVILRHLTEEYKVLMKKIWSE